MSLNLLKAAVYKPPRQSSDIPILPSTELELSYRIDPRHCEKYHTLVQWQPGIASVVHPCYLQVLTLPMQLGMMVKTPFPFKSMGLVHVANKIEVFKLPEQNAELRMKVYFEGLQKHKRGWVFGLVSECYLKNKLMMKAKSVYLSKAKHCNSEAVDIEGDYVDSILPSIDTSKLFNADHDLNMSELALDFKSGVGRQYAKVSGDYNPIHLANWTAQLLGFRKAIVHGMYSKALCLSKVFNSDVKPGNNIGLSILLSPDAAKPTQIETQFLQPIYLPTATLLRAQKQESVYTQSLFSSSKNRIREHVNTQITFG